MIVNFIYTLAGRKKKLIELLQDTWRNGYRRWFPKETIIWRLQVQSSVLQASNNTGILNTSTRLWLTESEQATPVDSIKDVVRSSVKVPEFDKHLNKVGGHIDRNVVEITINMKIIVRKPLMIKINQPRLRNLDNFFYVKQTKQKWNKNRITLHGVR